MKTLYLLRHAKAAWKEGEMRDFDRPLTSRGVSDASTIGRYLLKQSIDPQMIVSSPSQRTRETVEVVARFGELSSEIRFDERIYEAEVENLLGVMSQIGDGVSSLMLVGHNPGFSELVYFLSGVDSGLRTAELAHMQLNIDSWGAANAQCGTVKKTVRGKDLG